MEYVTLNVHIEYPEEGIGFSQLKKVFATFEEGCRVLAEPNSVYKEGKVTKVESGSIWLEVILPIVQTVLPVFINFISNKLCGKSRKKRIQVEVDGKTTIKIIVEE